LTITRNGTVVDGLDVEGTIQVNASHVTIKNTRVRGRGYFSIRVADSTRGVTVQDTEVDGNGTAGAEGSMGVTGPATVLRCNVHGVENGLAPGSGSVLRDNYVHGLAAPGSPHYDGIQIDGGIHGVRILHNTVVNDFDQTAALMIDNYFGPIADITVQNNRLIGGGYTVYSDGQFNGGSITGVKFLDNVFGKGHWGYASVQKYAVTASGNVDATSGVPVRMG